jgi:hypothetical protein
MEPTGLRASKKGLQVVHRCVRCGVVRANKIAELTDQRDDVDAIVRLMQERVRPSWPTPVRGVGSLARRASCTREP